MNTETAPLTASSPQVRATTASKFALSDGGITMVGQTRFLESRQIGNGKSASQLESLTHCPKTNCPLWNSIFRLGYRRPLDRRARTEFPRACGPQRVAKSKPSRRGR